MRHHIAQAKGVVQGAAHVWELGRYEERNPQKSQATRQVQDQVRFFFG